MRWLTLEPIWMDMKNEVYVNEETDCFVSWFHSYFPRCLC